MNTNYNYNQNYILNNFNNYDANKQIKSDLYCYEVLEPENENEVSPSMETNLSPYYQPATSLQMETDVPMTDLPLDEISQTKLEECTEFDTEITPSNIDIDSTNEQFSVNLLNIAEMTAALSKNIPTTTTERLQKLKSLCTFISGKGTDHKPYWNLWLEVPCKGKTTHINFVIEEQVYNSQCFPEYIFNSDWTHRFMCHFIKASVEGDDKNYYFDIRIDPTFETGEILHIKQAADLSGTEVKKLCMMFIDFIKPHYSYLHDDAKIYNEDESYMDMRIFLPLVNDPPKTWYTADGFSLAEYEQLEDFDGEPREAQSLAKHNQAVLTARSTLIKDLFQSSPVGFVKMKKKEKKEGADEAKSMEYKKATLVAWIRKYLKAIRPRKTFDNCTLHDLAKGIYLALRNKSDQEVSKQANQDFQDFYALYCQAHSFFPKDYQAAINVLDFYQLWIKTSEYP